MGLAYPPGTPRTASNATSAAVTAMSVAMWLQHYGPYNTGGVERCYDATRHLLLPTGAVKDIQFQRDWTTDGQWHISPEDEGYRKQEWFFIGVTYDGSSTANVPIFYLAQEGDAELKVAATVTTDLTPTGSLVNTAATINIGNRTDGLRPFTGNIAWWSHYDAVLTAEQMKDVFLNGFITTNCRQAYELITESGTEQDLTSANLDATPSGTPGPVLVRRAPYLGTFGNPGMTKIHFPTPILATLR